MCLTDYIDLVFVVSIIFATIVAASVLIIVLF